MTNKKFSYWTKQLKKYGEDEQAFLFTSLNEDEIKKLEEELNEANTNYEKLESEIMDIQAQLGDKDSDEQASLRAKILTKRAEQSKYKATMANHTTRISNCHTIKMVSFEIQRLKDQYLFTESLSIENFINGCENGKIITTPSKVHEDIYRFENFGVNMNPSCFDALAKEIKESYFSLKPIYVEFITNDVPTHAVETFARICYSHIQEKETEQEALYQAALAAGKEFEKDTYDSDLPGYYDVPVSDFKSWHTDSVFGNQNITHMKEALKIHKFICCNTGRLDFTIIAKKGNKKGSAVKVMRFDKALLQKINDKQGN